MLLVKNQYTFLSLYPQSFCSPCYFTFICPYFSLALDIEIGSSPADIWETEVQGCYQMKCAGNSSLVLSLAARADLRYWPKGGDRSCLWMAFWSREAKLEGLNLCTSKINRAKEVLTTTTQLSCLSFCTLKVTNLTCTR